MKLSRRTLVIIISAVLLVFDQVVKILIKTNFALGESVNVLGDWFQLAFIENKGMAVGMAFGGNVGKYILVLLRIALVIILSIYLRRLLKRPATPTGVLVGITLIIVGACGNIIDCLFYGPLFSESTYSQVAQFLPPGGGYAPVGLGKVVDMLYFPLIDTVLPSWVPFWGGEHFVFFQPVFNVADSCITCGAIYLILFHWKFFSVIEK